MIIICVDDHPIMLNGLAKNIQEMFPNAIIGAYSGADEAMEFAKEVMKIKPSGYLVKPAKKEQLAYELNNLRYVSCAM